MRLFRLASSAGLILLLQLFFTGAVALESTPPSCSDQEVFETFTDVFFYAQRNSQKAKDIVRLDEIVEIGIADPASEKQWSRVRGCSATAVFSDGDEMAVWYRIFAPKVPDFVGYRLQMCTAKNDPIHPNCDAFKLPPQ